MSNITSFDHRRKSLGELQTIAQQQAREIEQLQVKIMWHESYIETMEAQFSDFKGAYEQMNTELLTSIRELHKSVFKLNNRGE